MNYQETVDFLYAQLPMFSRVGASAFKKDLTNTLALCEYLGNPQKRIRAIHVAGTNGKGSVSHMLAAIFQAAGYKTGLYTSPHLKDFRERIKIDGAMCEQQFIMEFVEKTQSLIPKIQPSFFELTVAMAYDYFATENVDIAIIETGLGGRLDSTNVITPALSVITNIGWDHMDMLGDTLDKIAFEKAGIIKENVPVVIGQFLPETRPVFEKVAREKHAPIVFAEEKWHIENANFKPESLELKITDRENNVDENYSLDLPGIYQEHNLITVLESLRQMRNMGWAIPSQNVHEALSRVKKISGLHGRWEKIQDHPRVILDVGHNKSCMEEIRKQLEVTPYGQLYIICGFVKDKDIHAALEILPSDAHYTFSQAHTPRALPAEELRLLASGWGIEGIANPDVNDAIHVAQKNCGENDLILVCGSVFLVAEVVM